MRLTNPWIDPRVKQVRTRDFIRYLTVNGWEESEARQPAMRVFGPNAIGAVVCVPIAEKSDRFVQSIIEAITQLARAEDRYAGAVLDDILASADIATAPPGPAIGSVEPMTQPVGS